MASWEGESAPPPPDSHLVYTVLSRPLPDYAIEHTCRQCGPVEWVQLQQVICSVAPGASVVHQYCDACFLSGERLSTALLGVVHQLLLRQPKTWSEEGVAGQHPHACFGHRYPGSHGSVTSLVTDYSVQTTL